MLQMVHPDRVVDEADLAKLPLVEPVYPLTEGLGLNQVRKARRRRARAPAGAAGMAGCRAGSRASAFRRFAEALRTAASAGRAGRRGRRRRSPGRGSPMTNCWPASSRSRWCARICAGRPAARTAGDGHLRKKLIDAPCPTRSRRRSTRAVAEIVADLAKPERMLRLLQGDVGSGKTVVALLAAAAVIEAGRQAALMAPTEILARQHYDTIAPLAAAAGIDGRASSPAASAAASAAQMLERLAVGDIHILVGTHALFQDEVAFRDLALAVVDEQHRFGVHQRLALARKGEAVDVLVMTATPIPRTLVLTYFGDMDVSELREKPAGRQPIDTRTVPLERLDEVVDGASAARWRRAARVYWVCPLVEESESSDLAAARGALRRAASSISATWSASCMAG